LPIFGKARFPYFDLTAVHLTASHIFLYHSAAGMKKGKLLKPLFRVLSIDLASMLP
jgi:hypothetical protein